MTFGKLTETDYLLRLERGEEIITTLKSFCAQKNITNAAITGIGSVDNPTLAHYRVDTKKYTEKELMGVFEVTNLQGTIAVMDNAPLPHVHVTLGDEAMQALAGHLIKGTVSATLEITVIVYPTTFTKSHDEEIGLNLYNLPEKLTE
jgi:predicted DNA-binding protein with PD1-like motif